MFKAEELFDLSQTGHAGIFGGCANAWDALTRLNEWLRAHLRPGHSGANISSGAYVGRDVFIGAGTVVEPGAMIKGPAWIGKNCEIRHGAYVRDQVIVGDGSVIGNACELKHSLLFNSCAVPHFNYVGDSILGYKAHLGAGVKISNVKLVAGNVMVETNEGLIDSGLRKFGALVGDEAEVGCNSVLNPGAILGRRSVIYPCTNWRGVLPCDSIAKNKAPVHVIARKATRGGCTE